jgi:hypothetical protein
MVEQKDVRPLPDSTSMDRLFRDFKDRVRPLRTTTWKLKARIAEGCANTEHSGAAVWSRLDIAGARCELCLRNTFQLVFEVEFVSCVYLIFVSCVCPIFVSCVCLIFVSCVYLIFVSCVYPIFVSCVYLIFVSCVYLIFVSCVYLIFVSFVYLIFVSCVYPIFVSCVYLILAVSNKRLNSWRLFADIEWLCVSRYRVVSPTSRLLIKIRDQKSEAARTIAAWLECWRLEAQI